VTGRAALLASALVMLTGCQREEREFRPKPPVPESVEQLALSPLSPGGSPPVVSVSGKGRKYEETASDQAEGKRLFAWFNCTGCHSNGGGGSGPALMDDKWIYGSAIESIVDSIRAGRPNGMPSFRGKIPDEQIWQLAGYVRALGGLVAADVAPSRNDDLNPHPAENRLSIVPPGASPPPGLLP
jgi:cytochrome c oxidase cbb3-type subunit 3